MSGKKRSRTTQLAQAELMEDLRRATAETDRMFDQRFRWPVTRLSRGATPRPAAAPGRRPAKSAGK